MKLGTDNQGGLATYGDRDLFRPQDQSWEQTSGLC